ncbi:putative Heat shock protein 70 family [Helianthus debilis subsp. tardiflorus]
MNGDEAVAFGAAILAARLSGNDVNTEWDIVLHDVTPLSLGIAADSDCMSVVIPRNTSILAFKKGSYYSFDNSTIVRILVFQGENNNVKDNVLLGGFDLYGLMPGSNETSDIEVCFN